jgi:nucleotide-binding universal stress UspA family protein
MHTFKTVLHPTDFCEHSRCALRLAAAIARDQGATLILMHVVPRSAPVVSDGDKRELEKEEHWQRDLLTYQEEMLGRLRCLQIPGGKVPVEYLFKEGDAARMILKTADERSCDLIVMGTHGKLGYERAVLGSVAEEVGRKATCPVLTVRMPLPKKQPTEKPVLAEAVGTR